MTDELSFLDGQEPAEPAVATEAPAAEPAAPATEAQPRGEDGKFAPKTEPSTAVPVAPASGEPAPATAADPSTPPPGYVPIGVVAELRKEIRELKQPGQAPAEPQIPDRFEDPEGYEAYQQQQTQILILSNKLDMSEDMARGKHGDEAVDAAKEWAKGKMAQSPAYQQEVFRHRNPYAKIVEDHQREQAFADVSPDELSQFRAWKAAQAQAPAQPNAAPAASPQPAAPSRSIVHSPAAGGAKPGQVPVGPSAAFDQVFT